jgi:O-antigen biosynthesis protein
MLDVVILTHKQDTWLDLCLRAIRHHTVGDCRVVVVAMGATSACLAVARLLADEVVVSENVSYAYGINLGVRSGKAKNVVLLDDDALVHPAWDQGMLAILTDPRVGIAGARCQLSIGPQGNPALWSNEHPSVAFFCAGFRREVYNQIGPLDEVTFDGFSFTDIDYCWTARKFGYVIKVAPSQVYHVGLTHGANGQGLAPGDEKYRQRLVEKWGNEWVSARNAEATKGSAT